MDIDVVIERVQRVAAVRADDHAGVADLETALRDMGKLQSWFTATKASLTTKLAAQVSFPEKTIADCTRGSTRDAIRDKERADTLASAPGLADALDDARVTTGHVDELTRATKQLDGDQRDELLERLDDHLLDVAAVATIEDWRRRLALEIKQIQRDDGIDRLERQRRNTRLRSWTDGEGMWCLSGRFDPVTGVRMSAKLDAAVNALFAEATPDTCPEDPFEKHHHLQALALASLIDGGGGGVRQGRPEFVVVVDTSHDDGAGGPAVDWGIPVEVPYRVLADLAGEADVHVVVVGTGSCSTPRASSTSAVPLGWRTAPNAERCGPCTRPVRSPGAVCGTTAASSITWCGGGTEAAPISRTCCPSALTTTARSTMPDGRSSSAPNANSPSDSPTAPCTTPAHPPGGRREERTRREGRRTRPRPPARLQGGDRHRGRRRL